MSIDSPQPDPAFLVVEEVPEATPAPPGGGEHDRSLNVLCSDEPRVEEVCRVVPVEPASQTGTRNVLAVGIVALYLVGVFAWIAMGVAAGDTSEVKSALLVLASLAVPVAGYYFRRP